jgi:hypothetical protein
LIFLWGALDDAPMAIACAALRQAGAQFVFLDHRKIARCEIDSVINGADAERCTVTVEGATIDITGVTVAYVRGLSFYQHDELRGLPHDSPPVIRAAAFEAQLTAWLDASDAVVINRSAPSATNNSKPYQTIVIRQAGFAVPETLLCNDAEAARTFLIRHPDSIYKSMSGVRSIVRRLGEAQRAFIDDVQWCPTLFQRAINGTNYRAHVLGDRVFAAQIVSDQIDYRYGRSTITPAELPPDVAQRCRRLTAMLGLHLAGIDLMRSDQGEWFCFEVNPSPGYPYYEAAGGPSIGAALARFMIDADASRRKKMRV